VTEQLTDSETRILRYLPTHLTAHEIADELFLSVNTVGTHTRHLYAKLGVHSRHEAIDRARALGLLAPSARRTLRRAGRLVQVRVGICSLYVRARNFSEMRLGSSR